MQSGTIALWRQSRALHERPHLLRRNAHGGGSGDATALRSTKGIEDVRVMPTVHVNDIDIYYEIHGEGKPLLMIQGLGFEISSMTQEPVEVPGSSTGFATGTRSSCSITVASGARTNRTCPIQLKCWLTIRSVSWTPLVFRMLMSWGLLWDRRLPKRLRQSTRYRVKGAHSHCWVLPRVLPLMRVIGSVTTIPGDQREGDRLDIHSKVPANTKILPADGRCR